MGIKEVILIIATILNLGLGFFIYFKNRKNKINISYAFLSLGLAGWALTNAIFQITPSLEKALFWARLSDISAILLVSSLFYFSLVFPEDILISQKYQYYLLYSLTILVTLISLPNFDFVRKEVAFRDHVQKQIITGNGFYIFAFYILLFLIWTIINLKEKYKISKGIVKFQLQYVFIGIVIGILFGATFNLILPLMGNYSLVWLGPISTLISLIFIGLAITRYHLFGVRVILTELLVGIMGLILFLQMIFAPTKEWKISALSIFILFLIFGYLLIKYTHQEIKRKEELEDAYKKIEALSEIKSEFLKVVNHQLRTPVSIIKGMAEMLKEGRISKERQKEFVEKLYLSSERLGTILDDILVAHSLTGGMEKPNFSPCQIEEIVEREVEHFRPQAKAKGIEILFKKPKEILPITLADETMVERIISRLIDNAILYSEKGEIEVSIDLKRENKKEWIKISVKDQGIGLDERDKENLFKLFYRGEKATFMHPNGSGLGLFIVKNYVEAHRGKIEAKSEGRGKGSTFIVSLPVITEL
jgi:signal transduction histidine kinase